MIDCSLNGVRANNNQANNLADGVRIQWDGSALFEGMPAGAEEYVVFYINADWDATPGVVPSFTIAISKLVK